MNFFKLKDVLAVKNSYRVSLLHKKPFKVHRLKKNAASRQDKKTRFFFKPFILLSPLLDTKRIKMKYTISTKIQRKLFDFCHEVVFNPNSI